MGIKRVGIRRIHCVLVCVVLTGVCALVTGACTAQSLWQGAVRPESGTAATGVAASPGTESGAREGPFGKYDPVLPIRFVRDVDEDLQINILPNCPGETMEENRWIQAYRDRLGIEVAYDWMTPSGDAYNQKINVIIASGDLPDVIGVDAIRLRQMADADLVADLTDAWETHATDRLKAYYAEQGPGVLGITTYDGRLKGLMQGADAYWEGTFLWIRADWLRALGLDPPRTMADVRAISQAFTTQDPDGNGEDDTFGLAVYKDLYFGAMGLEGFCAGYHAYPFMWVERGDGTLVYGSLQPEMKAALATLADMYAQGEIDPEFGVKEVAKVAETIVDGRIGMEFGAQWNPMYPLIGSHQQDPEADWTGYPLVSADDRPVRTPGRNMSSRYLAVRKDFPHPEALIRMFNLHVALCWGENGDFNHYYMPEENGSVGVWKFSPVQPAPPSKNVESFLALQAARQAGTLKTLTGEAATIHRNIEAYLAGDRSQWGWERIYGPEGVMNWAVRYREDGAMLKDAFVAAPTLTMVERKTTLEKLEREMFVKIIVGAEPIDAFDAFVEDWYRLGGAKITEEVNAWAKGQTLR